MIIEQLFKIIDNIQKGTESISKAITSIQNANESIRGEISKSKRLQNFDNNSK